MLYETRNAFNVFCNSIKLKQFNREINIYKKILITKNEKVFLLQQLRTTIYNNDLTLIIIKHSTTYFGIRFIHFSFSEFVFDTLKFGFFNLVS